MKNTFILIAFTIGLIITPQLALEYFANGCMVWDHHGKIVKTGPNTFEYRPTIRCTKIFLK